MEKLVNVMDIGYEDNQVRISFAEPEEAEDCFVYDDELSGCQRSSARSLRVIP